MFPAVKRFLQHLESFENDATGLLDLPQGDWSTTAYIESLGFESRFGQSTALNAIYYQTLLQAAGLAEQCSDAASANKWKARAAIVRQNANDLLYLPAEHSYATTYYQGKLYPPTPQALAWGLAYGLASEENSEPLVDSLLRLLSSDPSKPNLDIYGMHWLLEALGRNGHVDEALDIIKIYYGRLLDSGATTWWENFNADQNRVASFSHAWGGSPTWFLSTYALGASMTGPHEWYAAPALSGIQSASGSIPVGDDQVTVSWERRSCEQARISIASGIQTHGEILIPFTDPLIDLTVNGSVLWKPGNPATADLYSAPDGLHMQVDGGSYTIVAAFHCENPYHP